MIFVSIRCFRAQVVFREDIFLVYPSSASLICKPKYIVSLLQQFRNWVSTCDFGWYQIDEQPRLR